MNQTIKLTKGLDLPMEGSAECRLSSVCRPSVFSIIPDHFEGIKPRLVVKEGARVKAGSAVFSNKQNEEMLFTSPVSGTVIEVVRGERRKIMAIRIEADAVTEYEHFEVKAGNADEVRALLLKSGLWSLLRQRPYDCIAMPEKTPKAVFVSAFDSAPLAPDYDYVVKGHAAELQAAVNALAMLAPVYVGVRVGKASQDFRNLKNCVITEFDGPHPAGNVSVQINHILPIAKGETVYVANPQDLLIIGRLLLKGIVDMQRMVALTGDLACERAYYNVLPGMPLDAVLRGNVHKEVAYRIVSGNVLSGHKQEPDEMFEPQCNQLTIIAEGTETHDFMGWIAPRFNNFSVSPAIAGHWLAKLGMRCFNYDARLLGGRRAIIVSGEYDKVFPMDIYPEYLIKAMIAGNLDKMEQLGAYEVAPEDFALCEYVCTSKMPLQAIVRKALDNMKSELE